MVSVRRSILYLFLMTLLFPFIASAVVPTGYLDTSFRRPYGYATYPTPYMYGERPNAVALQKDGKVVVVDTTAEKPREAQIAVTRYNPDGTPDGDFNGSGTVLYNNSDLTYATDVAIQSINGQDKIIVAGFRSPDENLYDLILLRYNTDGTLDTSFYGEFTTNVGFDGVNTSASLAIQNDGKILVATHGGSPGSDSKKLVLLRFNQNGSLDQGFGSGGFVEYTEYIYGDPDAGGFVTDNINGKGVRITPDGSKIVVLIKVYAYTTLLRFDMSGTLDTDFRAALFLGQPTFGGEYTGSLPRDMEVQPDGKIVVVGEAGVLPFVLRYTEEGNLDPFFGDGSGVVYFNYKDFFGLSDDPVRSSNARGVALQPDGNILMVGSCPVDHNGDEVSDDMDVFHVRYTSNGTIDTSFGAGGVVTFDGGWRDGSTYYGDLGEAVAVQPNGKVVVVGSIRVYDNPDNPDPQLSHNDMVIMRFGDQPSPEPPSMEISPKSYNFGEVENGKIKTKQFTLTNIGQSDLTISNIELVGADNAYFKIDPGTCQNLTPTIIPGGSCVFAVSFAPGSEGLKTAILKVTSNNPYTRVATDDIPVEVSLQGTGITVPVGYMLSVSTDGNGIGSVKSKPKGISCNVNGPACESQFLTGTEVILYPVVEQEGTRFTGWSGACSGRKECKVVMDSDKEVKATFMADPTILVCPQSKNFKDVRIGKMKAAFISVKNGTKNGKVPLHINGITLTGSTSSFGIFKDECSNRTLEPREVCMFGVVFDPDAVAAHAAEAQISSTDPASPIKTVALSGNGVAPPPPKPPRRK